MKLYFSKTTGGFYDPSVHGDNIPADKVEIAEAYWQQLLDGQSQGQLIVADAHGHPQLEDPPPAPAAEPVVLTPAQKLAAAGLSVDELKGLLGL
jgi:hypothetical protein